MADDYDPNYFGPPAAKPTSTQKESGTNSQSGNGQVGANVPSNANTTTSSNSTKSLASFANVKEWKPPVSAREVHQQIQQVIDDGINFGFEPSSGLPADSNEELYLESFDPESDDDPDDDDSLDLCSAPCDLCGSVPSYSAYGLCPPCLSDMPIMGA